MTMKKNDQTALKPGEIRGGYESPLGFVEIHASDEGITFLRFVDAPPEIYANMHEEMEGTKALQHLNSCVRQLEEYFSGKRTDFDVPVSLKGTDFQMKVWEGLLSICYGKTVCYEDIARMTGSIKASRAVGTAVGQNPVYVIVPCHRVIGKNGSLTSYGCGVERKQRLLQLEKGIT